MFGRLTLGLVMTAGAGLAGCDLGRPDFGGQSGGSGVCENTTECPPGTTPEGEVCVLQGEITRSVTLTADKAYLIRGGVFIGDAAHPTMLTIEPGTTLFGETASKGMLVIRRGSKIIADGTPQAPIVMTSPNLEGSRGRGDWGGLIINGRAPVNGCNAAPCESEGEGGTGQYGGDDPDDSSGILRYVRVEYAGILVSEDNELNGIAFQAVGRGTIVDHVQVHMSKDDGVEFFGGTVDVKHLLLTGIGDDSLDWTDGWQGRGQFITAVQFDDAGDQGIEADNNGENNDSLPRSAPRLANLTLWGTGGENSDLGILLREGTGARISGAIIGNFGEGCLAIDHPATFANGWNADMLSGALAVQNSIVHCPGSSNFIEPELADTPFSVSEFWGLNAANQIVDPGLVDPAARNFTLAAGSPAAGTGVTPMDRFFEPVDYIGAFGTVDWTAGWTNWAAN